MLKANGFMFRLKPLSTEVYRLINPTMCCDPSTCKLYLTGEFSVQWNFLLLCRQNTSHQLQGVYARPGVYHAAPAGRNSMTAPGFHCMYASDEITKFSSCPRCWNAFQQHRETLSCFNIHCRFWIAVWEVVCLQLEGRWQRGFPPSFIWEVKEEKFQWGLEVTI